MTEEVITEPRTEPIIEIHHIDPLPDLKVEIPVSNAKMKEFQEQDERIQHLRNLCSAGKLNKNIFIMENNILKKRVTEQALSYKAVVVPDILKESLMILAHDEQGHNGFKRTYNALKTLYYWKGMKRHIQLHCKRCRTCARHNIHNNEVYKEHFKAPSQPMEFLAIDLIGRISPSVQQRKQVCPHSNLYAYRFYMVHTLENKESQRSSSSLHESYLLHLRTIKDNTVRQWQRIQKQHVERGI